jgi:hypothetical protein
VVVSDSDKLSEEEKFKALGGIAAGALQLGLSSFAVLAARGLVDPDEVETVLSTLLQTFDQLPEKVRDSMPYDFLRGLAEVKRVAVLNWKSNG